MSIILLYIMVGLNGFIASDGLLNNQSNDNTLPIIASRSNSISIQTSNSYYIGHIEPTNYLYNMHSYITATVSVRSQQTLGPLLKHLVGNLPREQKS